MSEVVLHGTRVFWQSYQSYVCPASLQRGVQLARSSVPQQELVSKIVLLCGWKFGERRGSRCQRRWGTKCASDLTCQDVIVLLIGCVTASRKNLSMPVIPRKVSHSLHLLHGMISNSACHATMINIIITVIHSHFKNLGGGLRVFIQWL